MLITTFTNSMSTVVVVVVVGIVEMKGHVASSRNPGESYYTR